MINNILVALDPTESDDSIFKNALFIAKNTGAKLIILQVIAPTEDNYPNPFIYSGYEYDLIDESLVNIYQEEWEKFKQERLILLRSLVKEAKEAGIEAESIEDYGDPGRTICQIAQTHSTDLILIGSRGLTGVREMLLGSVSNYVTHHAPCSVLIIRQTDNSQADMSQDKSENAESLIS